MSKDLSEEISILTEILEVDNRLKELNLAKDYLNSNYYWKRYNELKQLKQYLLKENIRKFNLESDKNLPNEEPEKYPKLRN